MEYLDNIKRLRKANGITQLEMSERLGMAKNNYGKVESGVTEMTVSRLYAIAEILGVSVTALLGENTGVGKELAQLEENISNLKSENVFLKRQLDLVQQMFDGFKNVVTNQSASLEKLFDSDQVPMDALKQFAESMGDELKPQIDALANTSNRKLKPLAKKGNKPSK
jgi:HTH-type transcriptional regulator/antitoxin HipB